MLIRFIFVLFLGCDPLLGDKDGRTVVHEACVRDQSEVLKLLFHVGIDMQVSDGKGRFQMHIAAACGSKYSKIPQTINFYVDCAKK